MEQRRGQGQIGVELTVKRAGLQGETGHGDGVFEQPAEVGVVAGCRARSAAQLGAHVSVVEEGRQDASEVWCPDLSGEVVEEAVELVDVAVGRGEEVGHIDRGWSDARYRAHEHEQLAPELLDLADDPNDVAALEVPGRLVGGDEHPCGHRAAAIA